MRRGCHFAAAISLAVATLVSASSPAKATVSEALFTVFDVNRTSITWLAEPVTTKYDIYVNGVLAKSVAGSGLIDTTMSKLLGPADKVEIVTTDQPTKKVAAVYWANDWVHFPSLNIRFSSKSSTLSVEAKRQIATFAKLVKAHGFTQIRAIGHDAGIPGAAGAYELGRARAKAVMAQLRTALDGADVSLIRSSWGNAYPIASNATAAGQAENRRVELTLM